MLGVFLDSATIDWGDIDLTPLTSLLPNFKVYSLNNPADITNRVEEASVVISNKVLISASLIAKAQKLKLILAASTGVDQIDLAAASAASIPVCNVPHYATESVADHTFLLILAASAQLPAQVSAVFQGHWSSSDTFCLRTFASTELKGKVLGIVGFGAIGQAVAARARAFGLEVVIAQKEGAIQHLTNSVPLKELANSVDILSLHCPLNRATKALVNAELLASMKPNAILINTARGALIDEMALYMHLKKHPYFRAALDVLTKEPPPADHPLLQKELPNVMITPHIAWAAKEARVRLVAEIAENLKAFLQGSLKNQVF